uniref:Uncharacterized protein n=1 Tax=Glossina brevipalpis TaxID=37001 RepID=A0A1A9WUZ8_9MUSC
MDIMLLVSEHFSLSSRKANLVLDTLVKFVSTRELRLTIVIITTNDVVDQPLHHSHISDSVLSSSGRKSSFTKNILGRLKSCKAIVLCYLEISSCKVVDFPLMLKRKEKRSIPSSSCGIKIGKYM